MVNVWRQINVFRTSFHAVSGPTSWIRTLIIGPATADISRCPVPYCGTDCQQTSFRMIAQTCAFNAVLSDFPQQCVQFTSNKLVSFGQVCGKTQTRLAFRAHAIIQKMQVRPMGWIDSLRATSAHADRQTPALPTFGPIAARPIGCSSNQVIVGQQLTQQWTVGPSPLEARGGLLRVFRDACSIRVPARIHWNSRA